MKLNKIFWASCAVIGAFALSSCEKYDDLFPEQYHRVLNIKNAGISSVDLYTTDEEGVIELSVMKTGSEAKATATGTLSAMTEEAFNTYCSNNNLLYTYLPAEYYELKNNNLQFGEDERYKFVQAVIKNRDLKQLVDGNADKTYAIPLLLSSTDASVNDSLMVIVPNVMQPTLGFTKSGYVQAIGFIPASVGSGTANVEVQIPIVNQWDLKCTLVSDQNAKDRFDDFNTSGLYELLPEEAYELSDNGVITFAEGASTASLKLTVNSATLDFTKEYVLPLSVIDPTVEGFQLDESNNVVLLGVAPGKIQLTVNQLSANSVQDGDGTGLMGLIDGIGAGLHFHSIWSAPIGDPVYGNYFQIALSSPLTKVKFNYWTRFENASAAPKHIKIFVSSNGSTWNEIKDIQEGLPVSTGNEEYSSEVIESESEFKYFRFAVLRSVAGDLTTGSWFNLGEFALYGE